MSFLSETETHPAEKLHGFTARVKLLAGTVLIRKVNIEAVTMDAAIHVINAKAALKVASEHAKEAGDLAAERRETPARPRMEMEDEIQTTIEASRRILRSALLQPRLEELVTAYGAREDLSEPDLGLGPDFDVLMQASNQHNSSSEEAEAKAERFPDGVGGGSGQPGPEVSPASQ